MNQIKKVSKKIILAYCIPQFAVGLFTAMISNYLLYFYQPSKESGIPTLITQGVVVLGILTFIGFVKAVGHIIDAVTDPLVAHFLRAAEYARPCQQHLGGGVHLGIFRVLYALYDPA